MMDALLQVDSDSFAAVIGDATRREMMKHLCCAWLTVGELVEKLNGRVNQPTVSHHLKRMEAANLVFVRHEGRQHWYTLNQEHFTCCCNALVATFAPEQFASLQFASQPLPPISPPEAISS